MAALHDEKLALAEELLADIELSRLEGQSLLMKANRLARLLGSVGLERFVRWELFGYPEGNELAEEIMGYVVRHSWGDFEAIRYPLSTVIELGKQAEAAIEVATSAERTRARKSPTIVRARTIENAVVRLLHDMVTQIHYELAFSAQQAALFESVQASIDARLTTMSGEALDKIDAIYERLEDGGSEAISHALTSCRRLIAAVADALCPPRDEPVEVGGKTINLTAQNVINRLETYISENDGSKSRRERLRKALEGLWNRTSTGVHADVTAPEARFLFLHTYIVLGEIVSLGQADLAAPLD
jgi:hypothetical protein